MCDAVCTIVHKVSVASSEFGLLVTLDLIEPCHYHIFEIVKFIFVFGTASKPPSNELITPCVSR